MTETEQDFIVDDEDEIYNSLEHQMENIKTISIGNIDDEKDAYYYISLYQNIPNLCFSCSISEPAKYIERYDVFESKLNKSSDFVRGFHILGCLNSDIEHVLIQIKLQEKKPRTLMRFDPEDIVMDGPTYFEIPLPCSFVSNKPEYYLEVQFKDQCPILNLVRIEIYYLFLNNSIRSMIEYTQNPIDFKNKKMSIKEKKLFLT